MNHDDKNYLIGIIRDWAKTLPDDWREVAEWQCRKGLIQEISPGSPTIYGLQWSIGKQSIGWAYVSLALSYVCPFPPVPEWLAAMIAKDRAEDTAPAEGNTITAEVRLCKALDEIDFILSRNEGGERIDDFQHAISESLCYLEKGRAALAELITERNDLKREVHNLGRMYDECKREGMNHAAELARALREKECALAENDKLKRKLIAVKNLLRNPSDSNEAIAELLD